MSFKQYYNLVEEIRRSKARYLIGGGIFIITSIFSVKVYTQYKDRTSVQNILPYLIVPTVAVGSLAYSIKHGRAYYVNIKKLAKAKDKILDNMVIDTIFM
jgi:hypothetical protein